MLEKIYYLALFLIADLHYSRFRFRMEQTQSIGPDVDHQCPG